MSCEIQYKIEVQSRCNLLYASMRMEAGATHAARASSDDRGIRLHFLHTAAPDNPCCNKHGRKHTEDKCSAPSTTNHHRLLQAQHIIQRHQGVQDLGLVWHASCVNHAGARPGS